MPTLASLSLAEPLLWLLCLASLLVGMSKGGLPGIGMLAVPILSLMISPVIAAVLLLPIYILSDAVGVWLYRHEYSLKNLQILIPAGIAGVLVGWATAARVPDEMVSFLIGVLGVSFCLSRWLRRSTTIVARPVELSRGLFWGTLSGFTSFVSHAGAPPYQIFMLPQQLPKMVFAGTTTILFACINLAKVVPYSSLHPYSGSTLWLSVALVPIAAIGTIVGKSFIQKLPEKWFFLGVQIVLFLVSLKLVYDGLSVWLTPSAS